MSYELQCRHGAKIGGQFGVGVECDGPTDGRHCPLPVLCGLRLIPPRGFPCDRSSGSNNIAGVIVTEKEAQVPSALRDGRGPGRRPCSRRDVLVAAAVAIGLSACSGQGSSNPALAVAAQDVAAIAGGLNGTLPAIGASANIAPAAVARIGAAVADLQPIAAKLAKAP